jgi:hypothetical protein
MRPTSQDGEYRERAAVEDSLLAEPRKKYRAPFDNQNRAITSHHGIIDIKCSSTTAKGFTASKQHNQHPEWRRNNSLPRLKRRL